MRIAIVGGSGLVGRAWLQSRKDREDFICSFQRNVPKKTTPGVTYKKMDVTNSIEVFNALHGFDLVIHASALVSYHKKHVSQMYRVNVEGTTHVVNACLRNNIPKLILISSTAALDSNTNPNQITEDQLWDRQSEKTEYAKTKYYAELEAWRGQEEGLQVATVCPGVVLGDGEDSKSSNQLYDVVRKKWNLYPTGSNGFINANELAKIINLIIDGDGFGHRYMAVTHNIRFKELLQGIAQKLNLPPPKYSLSGFRYSLVFGIAKVLEFLGFKSPLPSSGLLNTKQDLVYKPINIYQKLGYEKGALI